MDVAVANAVTHVLNVIWMPQHKILIWKCIIIFIINTSPSFVTRDEILLGFESVWELWQSVKWLGTFWIAGVTWRWVYWDLSLHHYIQNSSGSPPAFCSVETSNYFPRSKNSWNMKQAIHILILPRLRMSRILPAGTLHLHGMVHRHRGSCPLPLNLFKIYYIIYTLVL